MEPWVPFILFVLSWTAECEPTVERRLMADEAACDQERLAIDGVEKDGKVQRAFCLPFFSEQEVDRAWEEKRSAS